MKLLIECSGVRKSVLELTECELKDLYYAIEDLLRPLGPGGTVGSYGCVLVKIVEDADG